MRRCSVRVRKLANIFLFFIDKFIFQRYHYCSMNLDQALDTIGIDKNKTLKRFSENREMLKYFVKQFPQDKTIAQLKKAFPEKNWETIEDTAHTLKGISGNLGFESLYKLCTSLVDEIRSKNYSKAELLYPAVISSCDKIVEIIKQID